ncbi:hypothetical protein [Erythrobacter mangrovi]|uniref:Lipoprotein n=1 Tax=Erythrobacter mangrovi TaxID=2739433 RepID=A0A7D4C4R5_9SPHN|nr:hypothetical protein [Erythrobacter mangrovi]QKG71525.1 hypothetical protein HQR01_09210 [Erythrobacter mangrovi]
MRRFLFLSLLILGACSDKPTEEERRAAVAEVEKAQEAPAQAFGPQAILYPDIEKNSLYGAGCSFVPDGGGLGAVALAMAEEGYMKRDGEILRFAADKGSKELPYLAHAQYDGRDYAFVLTLSEVDGEVSGEETINFPASLSVTDSKERVVYQAQGIAQCGA